MAYGYSHKFLEQNKFVKKPIKNLLCKNWRLISKYRGLLRKFDYSIQKKFKKNLEKSFNIKLKTNLEDYSEFFKKNDWCFIEEFFEKDICEMLIKNWPKKFILDQ